ncbi:MULTISPECIES: LCP family protein [Streptomyces]|uniref:LCP family protein n=2 Tax=Streptomyces TaxID=1883 RepID=A0ABU2QUE0_9ACTN|nr:MULTISPECIES: LCP family protein [unclassified Streptomyces]MDT0407647.1 LCP family protein [Streptomyces sp. DSM 41979]MDT0421336.1 LCP family protein [Streptomyces sp. DSM 41859]
MPPARQCHPCGGAVPAPSPHSPRPRRSPRARPLPRRPPSRRRRALRWAVRGLTGCSVAVLLAAGAGHTLLSGVDHKIGRVDAFKGLAGRPSAGHGMNLLLAGTDEREGLDKGTRQRYRLGGAPCHCTDTLMIVHLSADHSRASVVSLPRDSYAMLPPHVDRTSGEHHHEHPVKLNAAYAEGGPQLTVRTVEKLTKVKIDHYVEVDFTSFMRTVDALGGVEICTAKPLKDSYTGLDLPAGSHELDGGQALQYVRARHIDAASDLGRMQRQQRFLAAVVERATSGGTLLNPVRLNEVADALLSSVRADKGFGTDEILDLARAMRGFSPSSSEFVSMPLAPKGRHVPGIGDTLVWDADRAKALFTALREDHPLAAHKPAAGPAPLPVDVPPQQISVRVLNGTGTAGEAERVAKALRATGFTATAGTGTTDPAARTTIAYDPGWDRSAKSLATAVPHANLVPRKGLGATLEVTVGKDTPAVAKVRAEDPAQAPKENKYGAVRGDEVTCPS